MNVSVYGGDHSPWVQAVLLGLHEKKIAHTVRTVPPISVFKETGILMPAASINGGPWQLQSGDILQAIGFEAVAGDDMLALFRALRGGIHRVDSAWQFWHEWSFVRDYQPGFPRRLRNHLLRPFSILYFFLALRGLARQTEPGSEASFRRQFSYWEHKLESSAGPFLGGDSPETLDLMLFGVLQCHCSIPVPPIPVVQEDPSLPRLRSWIKAMQERFAEYPHLYSGLYFEPHSPAPPRASLLDRAIFWCGSALTLIAFPITLPLAYHYIRRIRRLGLLRMPTASAPPAETRQVDSAAG